MFGSKRRWLVAFAVPAYLYFLLPATAVGFYELYHLTGVEAVYWGYSAFKFAGYYFGAWPYQALCCLLIGAALLLIPALLQRLRTNRGTQ